MAYKKNEKKLLTYLKKTGRDVKPTGKPAKKVRKRS